MLQLGTPLTQQFQQTNLQSILKRVEALRPDHILITGDVTNLALPEQFSTVHNLLIGTQRVLMNENPTSKLNPNLWTILPGNHDVSDQKKCAGQIRYNLCHFFEHFGELYPPASQADGYDNHFPVTKELKRPIKPEAGLAIRLICLDSNVEWPVTAVGFNARGRVDHIQWNRLPAALAAKKEGEVLLVALHHHPIVVPAMCTDLEDYFLSLDESTGRKLVALCATTGVSAILHGHFHKFSLWAGLVPPGTHPIHIVGSPAGTVSMPGQNTEFLELREATLNNRKGLALFLHSLKNGAWISTYNAFLD
jgi:3',5'-cyclic AMP phosphodiesterase CpdA